MHIVPLQGEYYVKLEMAPDTSISSALTVHFNVSLVGTDSEVLEYDIWDAETQPEVARVQAIESELLRAILDRLLTGRYINLDTGLLESVGLVSPTCLYISFNDREDDLVKGHAELQKEIEALIMQSVANFVNGMAAV